MDYKDIKFNQYYRVELKSYVTNNVIGYFIGYFINMRESNRFPFSKFYYFHDLGAINNVKHGSYPSFFHMPYHISQGKYYICIDEIVSLEEIDKKDLEKELFINGL